MKNNNLTNHWKRYGKNQFLILKSLRENSRRTPPPTPGRRRDEGGRQYFERIPRTLEEERTPPAKAIREM